jgi:hypothetical protein
MVQQLIVNASDSLRPRVNTEDCDFFFLAVLGRGRESSFRSACSQQTCPKQNAMQITQTLHAGVHMSAGRSSMAMLGSRGSEGESDDGGEYQPADCTAPPTL